MTLHCIMNSFLLFFLLFFFLLLLTHCAKKPVTTMLTYPWKCTVLHCNHLGNTWKPLVLMTRHFDYCPSASEYISRGRLAWGLLAFLCCDILHQSWLTILQMHGLLLLLKLLVKDEGKEQRRKERYRRIQE